MDDVLLEMKPDGHVVLGDGFSDAIRRTVRDELSRRGVRARAPLLTIDDAIDRGFDKVGRLLLPRPERFLRTYPMPARWAREMAGFYQASEPFWSYPPIPDV